MSCGAEGRLVSCAASDAILCESIIDVYHSLIIRVWKRILVHHPEYQFTLFSGGSRTG